MVMDEEVMNMILDVKVKVKVIRKNKVKVVDGNYCEHNGELS